jgi:glycosyltransferase involved in cell wall biosynthesis
VDLRALLVSYSFPPVGGAGVQRMAKLAKYLPLHGVRPAVLTVANPSVPLHDDSLLGDAIGVEIARAPTLEPAYWTKQAAWRAHAGATRPHDPPNRCADLGARGVRMVARAARHALFPDPQVLWQPAAHGALLARIAAQRDDVVLVSGPPFSQFLLAPLARAGGLGVVLDYRDEWSTLRTTYEMARSPVARMLGDPLEAALLRRAHGVVVATDEFRANLIDRFSFLDPGRIAAIPNGYDPADFPGELPSPPQDHFVMTYAGTVFALTSARGILGALRRLHARNPELARTLRVRFLGRIVDTELDAFDGTEALGVERIGYIPHTSVLRQLAASHTTLCLLDDVHGAERIFPAKIFELMHLGRPVLTLAPPHSALARLVERHALGSVLHPRDQDAIACDLERRLHAFRSGDYRLDAWRNATDIQRYDRRALAGEFAEIMREATSSARRRGS